MPNVLKTNINSILAQVASNKTQRELTSSMEKLSTGKRINKAGDDPAGLLFLLNLLHKLQVPM